MRPDYRGRDPTRVSAAGSAATRLRAKLPPGGAQDEQGCPRRDGPADLGWKIESTGVLPHHAASGSSQRRGRRRCRTHRRWRTGVPARCARASPAGLSQNTGAQRESARQGFAGRRRHRGTVVPDARRRGVGERRQVEVTAEVRHLRQSLGRRRSAQRRGRRSGTVSGTTTGGDRSRPRLATAPASYPSIGATRRTRQYDGDAREAASASAMSPASSPTMTTTSSGLIQPGSDGAATSGTSRQRGGMGDDEPC